MAVFQIKPTQKPHKNFYAYYRKDLTRIRYKRRTPPAVIIYRGNFAPKKFTGKEQDQETGLYYFGARYLDPKTSRWLSTDPALGDYLPVAPNNDDAKKHNQNLPGMGGVFNVINLHVYHYAGNNPVKYVDPDGRWKRDVHYGKTKEWATQSHLKSNYAEIVAKANNAVDSGKTDPRTGDQSMHFNTNNKPLAFAFGKSSSGGDKDSRMERFEEAFGFAVSFINAGRIEEGLEVFGRGLHALQDMHAHSDEFVGYLPDTPFGGRWSHAFSGEGSPPVPAIGESADDTGYDSSRIMNTERDTKAAIGRLYNEINKDARKLLFENE